MLARKRVELEAQRRETQAERRGKAAKGMWQDRGRQCEMKTSLHVKFPFAGRRSLLSCVLRTVPISISTRSRGRRQCASAATGCTATSGRETHLVERKGLRVEFRGFDCALWLGV